jgi:hypothetical protein
MRKRGQVTEGVVIVSVGDGPGGVGELPHRPATVVTVEARCPGSADYLVLVDAPQAIGVGAGDDAIDCLIEDLRITGRIYIVLDQILGGDSASRLRNAIAESVVDQRDPATLIKVSPSRVYPQILPPYALPWPNV